MWARHLKFPKTKHYYNYSHHNKSAFWDSVVGIITKLLAGLSGLRIAIWARIFLLSKKFRLFWPPESLIQLIQAYDEVDHSRGEE